MYDNYEDNNDDEVEISIAVPLLETQDDLIIQRRNSVLDIEKHILEIREMFQKLSTIVSLQNEQIKRIEDNIEEVHVNVQKAHHNLLTYLPKVVSNRGLIIQMFVVLAFFIFLFFMFFV